MVSMNIMNTVLFPGILIVLFLISGCGPYTGQPVALFRNRPTPAVSLVKRYPDNFHPLTGDDSKKHNVQEQEMPPETDPDFMRRRDEFIPLPGPKQREL